MAVQSSQMLESTPVAVARIRSRLRKATPVFTDGNPSQSPKNVNPPVQINTPEPQIESVPISTPIEFGNEKAADKTAPPVDKPENFAVPAVPVMRKLPRPQPKIPAVEPVREETLNDSEISVTTTSEPPAVVAKSTNLKRDRDKPNKEKKSSRKKFKKGENPEKTKMTMFDWIYFNPDTTPMMYQNAERAEILQNVTETNSSADNTDVNSTQEKSDVTSVESEINNSEEVDQAENSMPMPQVMIGPDGNIIIDEKSLMIQTSAAANTQLKDSPVVVEDSHTTYASFSKKRGKKSVWSHKETMKFYSALSTVGTDFSLMLDIFPKKTRHELRLKFKREEKIHKSLVEKAISDGQQFDLSIFDDSTDSDDSDEVVSVKQVKAAKVAARKRYSKKNVRQGNAKQNNNKNGTKRRKSRKFVEDETSDSDDTADEDTVNDDNREMNVDRSDKDLEYESTISNITNAMRTAVSNGQPEDVMADSGGALDFDVNDPTSKHSEAFQVVDNGEERVEDVDEDKDDEEEVIESLLKTTRYGRQPKRRTVFTMEVTEPKKNASRKEEQKKQTSNQ